MKLKREVKRNVEPRMTTNIATSSSLEDATPFRFNVESNDDKMNGNLVGGGNLGASRAFASFLQCEPLIIAVFPF
jgi:hypothetical protein